MSTAFKKTTELEQRLERLEVDATRIDQEIKSVTAQRNDAAAQLKKDTVAKCQSTLDSLNAEREATDAGYLLLKEQIEHTRETEGLAAAAARVDAITAESGEVAAEYEAAAQELLQRAQDYVSAREAFIDTFNKDRQLRTEAAALGHRFDLSIANSKPLPLPARHPVHKKLPFTEQYNWPAMSHRRESTERDDTKMRERRNYSEAANTPGYEIIVAAGLLPFPPLTQRQKDSLAAAEAQREWQSKRGEKTSIAHQGPERRVGL